MGQGVWVWGRAGRWKTAGILDVAVLHNEIEAQRLH